MVLIGIPQDDLVDHKNSNVHLQYRRHLCEEWGSRLERGQDLDNGSIVWLESDVLLDVTTPKRVRELLTVSGPRMRAAVGFVTCLGS